MKTSKSWGVSPLKAEISRTDYKCPGKDCGWSIMSTGSKKHAVGYSTDPPYPSRAGGKEPKGCLVLECPHCFTRFWFHIDLARINLWQTNCENWPEESD